ncbi:MAG: flagellar hook-basal body complex protein FliE [Euryarchaeota archaeon]|nr:flagellar hook-basal body complex protein FliE [Euryarchaeota archaeon]
MKVLVLTGMPGSGKSEAVKVAEEMGIPVHRMGDLVREMVKAKGFEVDRANMQAVADGERRKFGPDVWARRTVRLIAEAPLLVIDGTRSLEEVEVFRRELGDRLVVACVHASPRTRWGRIGRRGRPDDPRTFAELVERDQNELRWGLGAVIATADVMLVNEEGKGTLRAQMRRVLLDPMSPPAQMPGAPALDGTKKQG